MEKYTLKNFTPHLVLFVASMLLNGCAAMMPKPDSSTKLQNPIDAPIAKITSFNESLVCMDNLLKVTKVKPIYVTSQGISNLTNDRTLSDGGKEMLITTVNQMTKRSQALTFVAYGSDIRDILDLQGAHPDNKTFKVPDYFIRGGITQFNKAAWSGQSGAGASKEFTRAVLDDGDGSAGSTIETEDLTSSFSLNSSLGNITMDLSVGYVSNLQIVPNVYSSNVLALNNTRGRSITGDISTSDLGLSFSVTSTQSNDFNDIYRALIQVGAIELVGKLYKVPYGKCLVNAGDNSKRLKVLEDEWFKLEKIEEKNPGTLITLSKKALKSSGYFKNEINDKPTPSYRLAMRQYQTNMNLLPSGTMNFATYRMLNNYAIGDEAGPGSWWYQPNDAGEILPPFGTASLERTLE